MKDDLSVLLSSVAVYSNFYAIITIVLSFVAMTIFIIRLNNGLHFHVSVDNLNQNAALERPVVCQSNPFCVTLSEISQSSLKDGLAIHLSSLRCGELTVYWGPEIDAVFSTMAHDADTFLTDIEQNRYLQDKCLYCEHITRLDHNSSQEIFIPCSRKIQESELGPSPRKRYPCMVIAAVSSRTQYRDSEIIASLSIIHLKDSLLRMGSQILNQFIKTGDGKVYSIKPIYLATNQDSSADSNSITATTKNLMTTCTDSRTHVTNITSEESSKMMDSNSNCHTESCGPDSRIPAQLVEDSKNDSAGERSTDVNDTSSTEDSSDVNDASDEMSNTSSEEEREPSFPECIICQTRPQSRALLPCRHACVCHVCLKQLSRCPMCRADIESYFKLFHSDDDDIYDMEMQIPRDYESWLGYLYSYIGFP